MNLGSKKCNDRTSDVSISYQTRKLGDLVQSSKARTIIIQKIDSWFRVNAASTVTLRFNLLHVDLVLRHTVSLPASTTSSIFLNLKATRFP